MRRAGKLNRFCCARNATMLIGMGFLAASIRRIYGRHRGGLWWRRKRSRMVWRIGMLGGPSRSDAILTRMGTRKFVLLRLLIRECCLRLMAQRSALLIFGLRI